MGRLGDDLVNDLLDYLFGAGANALAPAAYDVALSDTQPTNAGANVTEPVGNGYARVVVPNDVTNWPAAVNRVKQNGEAISFPAATGSWGSPPFFVLYRTGTSDFVGWGNLASAQAIGAGIVPTFGPGDLIVAVPGV